MCTQLAIGSHCKLTIEHDPSGSVVARVLLTANPSVYPPVHESIAHCWREKEMIQASPCLKTTDYARSPRTSRAAHRVAVCAEHPSSPELAAEHRHGDSEVESMRCYREIVLDRCPAQSVRRCNRRQRRQARRPS